MREPGMARPLVFRSDVIPDVDGDDGTPVRFVQQHVETVGERVLAERNIHVCLERTKRQRRVRAGYRTTVSGMVGCLYAAVETCAAARAAASTIAVAAGPRGSL